MSDLKELYNEVIVKKLVLKGIKPRRKAVESSDTDDISQESYTMEDAEALLESQQDTTTYTKTRTEIEFEKVQQRKIDELADKRTSKSHRENIAIFNEKLSKMTDINDIPRLGSG